MVFSRGLGLSLVTAWCLTCASCASDLGTSLQTCFETEGEDAFASSVSGPVVSDEGFARTESLCFAPLRERLTVETPDGRARLSWEHPDFELALPVAGDVAVSEISTEFNGNSSFAVSDAAGLLAVFAPIGDFAPTAGGITVSHAVGRAAGMHSCGSFEVTAMRVRTAESDVVVDVGDSAAIVVDGVPFRFDAFASSRSTGAWGCTDGGPHQSWAAFREAQ